MILHSFPFVLSLKFLEEWALLGTPITDFIVLSGKDFDPSDPSFLPFLFLTSMTSACLQLWVATSLSRNLMAEDYRRAGDDTCRLFIGLNVNE